VTIQHNAGGVGQRVQNRSMLKELMVLILKIWNTIGFISFSFEVAIEI